MKKKIHETRLRRVSCTFFFTLYHHKGSRHASRALFSYFTTTRRETRLGEYIFIVYYYKGSRRVSRAFLLFYILFFTLLPRDAFATRLEVSFFFSCSTTTRARDVCLEPFWYFFFFTILPETRLRRVLGILFIYRYLFFIIVLYNLTSFLGSFFNINHPLLTPGPPPHPPSLETRVGGVFSPFLCPLHSCPLPRSKREPEGFIFFHNL